MGESVSQNFSCASKGDIAGLHTQVAPSLEEDPRHNSCEIILTYLIVSKLNPNEISWFLQVTGHKVCLKINTGSRDTSIIATSQ